MKTKRSFFVRASKADPSGGITTSLAALQSILAGYGIRVSKDQLKEAASQYEEFDSSAELSSKPATDFTSISSDAALIQIAQEVGLSVRAAMMPADYVVKGLTLPAMVLVRSSEESRWLLIWNRIGSFIQVMDPKRGQRHWYNEQDLVAKLRGEPITLKADEWLEEATSELFTASLENWLLKLGLEQDEAQALCTSASSHEPSWQGLATLGAATRLVDNVRQTGGFRRRDETRAALLLLFKKAIKEKEGEVDSDPAKSGTIASDDYFVPQGCFAINALSSSESPDEATWLAVEAVSLIQVLGLKEEVPKPTPEKKSEQEAEKKSEKKAEKKTEKKPNKKVKDQPSKDKSSPQKPTIIDFLREDGLLTPSILGISAVLAAGAVVLQTLLFRGFIELSPFLVSSEQRLRALGVLFTFAFILFLVELPLDNTLSRIGRRLDGRLRITVLSVLPFLASQYFQKFSTGELTERIHSVRALHVAPGQGSRMIRLFFQIIMTFIAVALIDLASAPLALLNALGSLIVTIFGFSISMRLNMELRGQVGFLSRFYLDSLLGLVAIRTHGAERAVLREYEGFVLEWGFVKWALQRADFWMVVAYELLTGGLTVLLVLSYLLRGGDPANLLLLFYWTHNITSLGQQFMITFQGFFYFNTVSQRFLKILSAPREHDYYPPASPDAKSNQAGATSGIEIKLKELSVEAAEQIILSNVTLTIEAGSQVAIVGPSGAGKSTLIGLLTGRYTKAAGEVLIDNEPLSYERMLKLRQEMAWIDPSVQLWNRTLLQNLRYGTLKGQSDSPLERVIEQADLLNVLGRLPDGLQTMLGGGGRLVSGGQGQRIRLGRAMLRNRARLVILDEPFRGLDREKRHKLLTQTRKFWPGATLICVTHDVGETLTFERVLVVEDGKIVEDDVPTVLAANPDSRYRALLEAEEVVRKKLWSGEKWRRLWLEDGQLGEK